jgi:hypothetical protein
MLSNMYGASYHWTFLCTSLYIPFILSEFVNRPGKKNDNGEAPNIEEDRKAWSGIDTDLIDEEELIRGRKELVDFVQTVITKIVRKEEEKSASPSGLRIFCMVHVGVRFDRDKDKYVYEVIKIARNLSCLGASASDLSVWRLLCPAVAEIKKVLDNWRRVCM